MVHRLLAKQRGTATLICFVADTLVVEDLRPFEILAIGRLLADGRREEQGEEPTMISRQRPKPSWKASTSF